MLFLSFGLSEDYFSGFESHRLWQWSRRSSTNVSWHNFLLESDVTPRWWFSDFFCRIFTPIFWEKKWSNLIPNIVFSIFRWQKRNHQLVTVMQLLLDLRKSGKDTIGTLEGYKMIKLLPLCDRCPKLYANGIHRRHFFPKGLRWSISS